VRRSLASVAALLPLASACSAASSGGFVPAGAADARAEAASDATTFSDVEEPEEGAGPSDAGAIPDSSCAPPTAATGATSPRSTPDGPGTWICADASGTGWFYSCAESTSGAHPQLSLVGGCSSYGGYDYVDASYAVAICASAACTAAGQYDQYCDAGTAVACPAETLEAGASPGSGCVPSFIGEWSSGYGLPGPLYCCP
jgi:hypothetical protein